MKLAIFWADLLHYHVARIKALFDLAEQMNHEVYAFALRSKSTELPVDGYQELLGSKVKILSDDPQVANHYSWISKRQVLHYLDECIPDVVAIIGYDGKVSRAALGWCRFHHKAAILMLVSQEKDALRPRWKEAIKFGLVNCYDAALVGGTTHIEYAMKLGMPRERIFLAYNVVDNEFWSQWSSRVRLDPETWLKRYELPKRYFLSAGRFISKKNFAGLIRAYAAYVTQSKEVVPWSLVIVGDGELKPSLQALVNSLGLSHLVHFPGYLSASDMAPVYGLASAFILPSSYFEQWGLVANEAMAAGLPVVISRICGCIDLVKDGVTGFTFDPLNESELTHLLAKLSDGSIDLEKMGSEAYQLITDKYSPQMFAQGLMDAAEVAIIHANSRRWQLWPSPWLWL